MSATSLTNDTRLPPQAAILGAALFIVGMVAVLVITAPWRNPPVFRSYAL